MTSSSTPIGIILFSHGSRDPLWATPIQQLVRKIQSREPGAVVACAYLELMDPHLTQAVKSMLESHPEIRCIHILPVFLGMGRHAREDLPMLFKQLLAEHPTIELHRLPPIGEQEEVLDAISSSALTRIGAFRPH